MVCSVGVNHNLEFERRVDMKECAGYDIILQFCLGALGMRNQVDER